jgi:ABC-type uncharacterized transport system fused permease/ATPase subunit
MAALHLGYLQLGVLYLVFGGLQLWWIGSVFRWRHLAQPMSEGEFRRTLERMWANKS